MTILGIDPGYDRVGIGIIEKNIKNELTYIYSTTIETKKKESFVNRLLQIENELSEIISIYKPNLIVIESLFFAKNVKTAIDVAQARGSILLTCARNCEHIIELTPMQIKSSLVGDGHATKDRVEYMVRQILKISPPQPSPTGMEPLRNTEKNRILDDEIDALSIALAGERHYLHMR